MCVISVIVPVYNAQNTLKRCVDSLLKQTFKDFEIILVDDGSVDNSLNICYSFVALDIRVKVFAQKNAGVSAARNLGIIKSLGKYICFVDSDDSVECNYLFCLLESFVCDRSIVIQGFQRITLNSKYLHPTIFESGEIKKENFIFLFSKYSITSFGFPFSKLFIKQIITENHIQFANDIHFSEDLIFVLEYLNYIDTVSFTNDTNYLYYTNSGSLSNKISDYKSEYNGLILFLEKMSFLAKTHALDLECLLSYSRASLSVFIERILLSIYLNSEQDKIRKIMCLSDLDQKYDKYILRNYLPHDIFHFLLKKAMIVRYYIISNCIMKIFISLRKVKTLWK